MSEGNRSRETSQAIQLLHDFGSSHFMFTKGISTEYLQRPYESIKGTQTIDIDQEIEYESIHEFFEHFNFSCVGVILKNTEENVLKFVRFQQTLQEKLGKVIRSPSRNYAETFSVITNDSTTEYTPYYLDPNLDEGMGFAFNHLEMSIWRSVMYHYRLCASRIEPSAFLIIDDGFNNGYFTKAVMSAVQRKKEAPLQVAFMAMQNVFNRTERVYGLDRFSHSFSERSYSLSINRLPHWFELDLLRGTAWRGQLKYYPIRGLSGVFFFQKINSVRRMLDILPLLPKKLNKKNVDKILTSHKNTIPNECLVEILGDLKQNDYSEQARLSVDNSIIIKRIKNDRDRALDCSELAKRFANSQIPTSTSKDVTLYKMEIVKTAYNAFVQHWNQSDIFYLFNYRLRQAANSGELHAFTKSVGYINVAGDLVITGNYKNDDNELVNDGHTLIIWNENTSQIPSKKAFMFTESFYERYGYFLWPTVLSAIIIVVVYLMLDRWIVENFRRYLESSHGAWLLRADEKFEIEGILLKDRNICVKLGTWNENAVVLIECFYMYRTAINGSEQRARIMDMSKMTLESDTKASDTSSEKSTLSQRSSNVSTKNIVGNSFRHKNIVKDDDFVLPADKRQTNSNDKELNEDSPSEEDLDQVNEEEQQIKAMLENIFTSRQKTLLSPLQRFFQFAPQISQALSYVHGLNISFGILSSRTVYLDERFKIKVRTPYVGIWDIASYQKCLDPENFIEQKNPSKKFGGFLGTSSSQEIYAEQGSINMPPNHALASLAPELFAGKPASKASDIYALATIFIEILELQSVHSKTPAPILALRVQQEQLVPQVDIHRVLKQTSDIEGAQGSIAVLNNSILSSTCDLIDLMLSRNEGSRPRIGTVLKWFEEIKVLATSEAAFSSLQEINEV
eukprot:g1559.t1